MLARAGKKREKMRRTIQSTMSGSFVFPSSFSVLIVRRITSVLTKLQAKIKLERFEENNKKRSCTLGLHGPWGETSSVFMRVTFTFPRDYPYGIHPQGTPTVDLEKNPLISIRDRAYILKSLRWIRERKRPCLEACLRFLLFGSDDRALDDDSSDDEIDQQEREITMSLLRNNKNLAEPRTSQGAFGPNGSCETAIPSMSLLNLILGELVCFFRAPPRIDRASLGRAYSEGNGTEDGTTTSSQHSQQPPQHSTKSYFQSPALVSDAVRRLGLAALDRIVDPIDPRHPEAGLSISRAMTHLLIGPLNGRRGRADEPKSYPQPPRQSMAYLATTAGFSGPDKKAAKDYVFSAPSLWELCEKNAVVAREHGRYDHERIFRTLMTLFNEPAEAHTKALRTSFSSDLFASRIIARLWVSLVFAGFFLLTLEPRHSELAKEKDVQMLAMLGMIVLQTPHARPAPAPPTLSRKPTALTIPTIPTLPSRSGGMDYFSLTRAINSSHSPTAQSWGRGGPSPGGLAPGPLAASLSSSSSSRGSWSSLFNTGSMRQFMHGVQDTYQVLMTPTEVPMSGTPDLTTPMVRLPDRYAYGGAIGIGMARQPLDSPASVSTSVSAGASFGNFNTGSGSVGPSGSGSRRRGMRKEASVASTMTNTSSLSRSWNEGQTSSGGHTTSGHGHGTRQIAISLSSAGTGHSHRKAAARFPDMNAFGGERRRLVFVPSSYEEKCVFL